jgi:transcriptional regulator with XRE-family HTH domain
VGRRIAAAVTRCRPLVALAGRQADRGTGAGRSSSTMLATVVVPSITRSIRSGTAPEAKFITRSKDPFKRLRRRRSWCRAVSARTLALFSVPGCANRRSSFWRLEHGMSIAALSTSTGLSVATISRVENRKQSATAAVRRRLIAVTDGKLTAPATSFEPQADRPSAPAVRRRREGQGRRRSALRPPLVNHEGWSANAGRSRRQL